MFRRAFWRALMFLRFRLTRLMMWMGLAATATYFLDPAYRARPGLAAAPVRMGACPHALRHSIDEA